MLRAADTICELRGALQVASVDYRHLAAENAKLRERVSEFEELTDGERYIPQEWYALLQAENAKLRKLVQYIYDECYGDDWFNEQADALGFEQRF